jgi:hypothetical protein
MPDERDEQIIAIFTKHDGKCDGMGYDLVGQQRDISPLVLREQAEACVAALTTAGFEVEDHDA